MAQYHAPLLAAHGWCDAPAWDTAWSGPGGRTEVLEDELRIKLRSTKRSSSRFISTGGTGVAGELVVVSGDLVRHAVPASVDASDRDLPFYLGTIPADIITVDLFFDRSMEWMVPATARSAFSAKAGIQQSFTLVHVHHLRFENRRVITGEREEAKDIGQVAQVLEIASGVDLAVRLAPSEAGPQGRYVHGCVRCSHPGQGLFQVGDEQVGILDAHV